MNTPGAQGCGGPILGPRGKRGSLPGGGATGLDVSSIMDTWIVLRNMRSDTDLSRRLHVVKARGIAHSNEVRRMEITGGGVRLSDLAQTKAHAGHER